MTYIVDQYKMTDIEIWEQPKTETTDIEVT